MLHTHTNTQDNNNNNTNTLIKKITPKGVQNPCTHNQHTINNEWHTVTHVSVNIGTHYRVSMWYSYRKTCSSTEEHKGFKNNQVSELSRGSYPHSDTYIHSFKESYFSCTHTHFLNMYARRYNYSDNRAVPSSPLYLQLYLTNIEQHLLQNVTHSSVTLAE